MGDGRSEYEETISGESASELVFFLNGGKIVEKAPDPEWTLAYYLRVKLGLCGTKEACGEGGCGACTVMLSKFDSASNKIINNAVNACLIPLCSVHGTAIITVEGIGSVKRGLHPVQERIAKSHGTQCGFCTPGFVMSMYALLRNNPEPTENEMEDAFQGNLCRCTGYRPIIQGFKTLCKKSNGGRSGCCGGGTKNGGGCCMNGNSFSFNSDTNSEVADTLFDESEFKPYDPKQDLIFPSELQISSGLQQQSLRFRGRNVTWIRPSSLEELLNLKEQYPNAKCIGGNTELGIETRFKGVTHPVLIHISDIQPLTKIVVENDHIKVGGAVTLSTLKEFCNNSSRSGKWRGFGTVFEALEEMLHLFAGQQIRNVATLAGNIVTGSPISDLTPILMACGATLTLCSRKGGRREVCMDESFYPKYRTTLIQPHEILEFITIPYTKENEFIWAAKQSRRREDDMAIVNTCMRVKVNRDDLKVEEATLVFGGMGPTIKIAHKTSKHLVSK